MHVGKQRTRTGTAARGVIVGCALVLAVVLLRVAANPVEAHARLTGSSPAAGSALATAPATMQLRFSEDVDARFSRAELLAAEGAAVAIGPLMLDPASEKSVTIQLADPAALTTGTYTLVWRVLSAADGHVTTGTLPFSVGTGQMPVGLAIDAGSARPPWWRIAIRWLELSSLLLVCGGLFFAAVVAGPVARGSALGVALRVSWWNVWRAAVVVQFLTLPLTLYDRGLLAIGADAGDRVPLATLRRLAFDSTFGDARLLRAGLLTVAVPVAWRRIKSGSNSRAIPALGAALAISMLVTLPLAGHAAAEGDRLRATVIDSVHVGAAAIWLGGLVYLAVAVRLALRADESETFGAVSSLVTRFSRLAMGTVAVLFLSGIGNAAAHVSGPRALRDQDYGLVLIAKHVVLVPLLVAAAVNLLINRPRLRRAMQQTGVAPIHRALRSVLLTISAELVLGLAIVLASAGLTELPPADAPLRIDVAVKLVTIDQRAAAGDVQVWLLGRLTGAPTDRYTITLSSLTGDVANLQRVIVEITLPTQTGAGEGAHDRFDAEPLPGSPETYVFPATRLGLQGTWDVRIVVRRAGLQDVAVSLMVDTSQAGILPPRLEADSWRLPRIPIAAWALLALALVVAAGGVFGVQKLPGVEPIAAALILTMVALIAAGFSVSAARLTVPETKDTRLANPFTGDPSSVTRGETVYVANCLVCHGPGGKGVEVADPAHAHGAGANLTDRQSESLRDGDLFHIVSNGIPGSAMPAYDIALTANERWDVVDYLRQLQESSDKAKK